MANLTTTQVAAQCHSVGNGEPGTTVGTLRQTHAALRCVRQHFESTGSIEVMTPALVSSTVTDPGIQSVAVTRQAAGVPVGEQIDRGLYLHTSPEFAMKRLLCHGSGDIHQICKVFRQGEAGSRHNPEFTMLEWYRVGQSLDQLIDETVSLVTAVMVLFGKPAPSRETRPWHQLIYDATGLSAAESEHASVAIPVIRRVLDEHGVALPEGVDDTDLSGWVDLLMSTLIYPGFNPAGLTVITDYPVSMSALAKTKASNHPDTATGHTPVDTVAERFELFWGAVELANGYHELTDADELQRRFYADVKTRRQQGLPEVTVDHRLLAAQRVGLPDCAGVAMGFDRLMMIATGANALDDVMPFSIMRA